MLRANLYRHQNYFLATKYYFPVFFALFFLVGGCKKFIEIEPPVDKITVSEVYGSDAGAASVLAGIYTDLTFDNNIAIGGQSIGFLTGLSADEVALKSSNINNDWTELYQNNLKSISNGSSSIWLNLYTLIFRVNSAISGINNSIQITEGVKKQLLGEVSFLRGFLYFYLVNLYGEVPLVLSPDINKNANSPRLSTEVIYQHIISDLEFAKANLSETYLNGDITTPSSERVRPNKSAATALLARVYLYTSQWAEAENASTIVINNLTYEMESLDRVFRKDSKEAIWQLQRTTLQQAGDAVFYFPILGAAEKFFYLNDEISSDLDDTDLRKAQWIYNYSDGTGSFNYPAKYKDSIINDPSEITEYSVVLRLAEQYLIRAEARAQQGKLTGLNSAQADLNVIISRAGLNPSIASSQSEILNQILSQRKLEFFTEWGHRWLDLKRTSKITEVMLSVAPEKNGSWEAYKSLYPIPLQEIQKNPALSGHQNIGY